jgi:hypothetical protein
MRDRTNRDKPDLRRTIEGIGMMYKGLHSLLDEEYDRDRLMFAIMAQGPIDQIRDLLDDVEWHLEDMIPQHLRQPAALPESRIVLEATLEREAA